MSGDLSRHPLFAKRQMALDGGVAGPSIDSTPPLSDSLPSPSPSQPSSRPSLPLSQPNRSSFPPQPSSPSQGVPIASPVRSPHVASIAPSAVPQWQSVVSPSPLPSVPSERILAIQTSVRSSPSPSSVQLQGSGDSAISFSSSSAQPVALRDPAELVQRATAESLKGVSDWGLNMRLVDLINNTPSKTEYILQSLMPRVLHKDHAIGLTALALLEAIVKNCPSSHALVGRREVLDSIVQILPKQIRDPNHSHPFTSDATRNVLGMERYDRILVVIQIWGKSFAYSPKVPGFHAVYKELLNAGVKFAEPDRDELAPVFTPPPNHKLLAERVAGIATAVSGRNSRAGSSSASPASSASSSTPSSQPSSQRSSIVVPNSARAADDIEAANQFSSAPLPTSFSPSSAGSRLSDPPIIWMTEPNPRDPELANGLSQVKLLLEVLDNSDNAESLKQDDIANMLIGELKTAQKRVVDKLQKPSIEDRIEQLLQMNDVLNNTMMYYEGLIAGTMRRREEMDEIRRSILEQEQQSMEKPHIRRANSYDMQSHDVKLVRDSQGIVSPSHQYHAEVSAPSFTYAGARRDSASPSRSPNAGSPAGEDSKRIPSSTANPAISSFLNQQGLRSSPATSSSQTSPVTAPVVSSMRSRSPIPVSVPMFPAAVATQPKIAAAPQRTPFPHTVFSSASRDLTDLIAAEGPAPSYGEVVQPYNPQPHRPPGGGGGEMEQKQSRPPQATSPLPSQPFLRSNAANPQQPQYQLQFAPAASPSPVAAPSSYSQPQPSPAVASPFSFPMQGGLPPSPEEYAAWYSQQMAAMLSVQQQKPPSQQQQQRQGEMSGYPYQSAAQYADNGVMQGEQGGYGGGYGEQGERGEVPIAPPMQSQNRGSGGLRDQFGNLSMR